jgi:Ca2+-binding EF-hand superfamily protein
MALTAEFPQILEYPPAPGLMTFCQFPSGTFGNVAAGTHAGSDRREAPVPADVRSPIRDITGEAVSKLKAPRALASKLARASRLCGEYYVISIESEDANMSIRKSILTILAITLIGTTPAWSQSLLKTLDPDNDGTVDLAEAKNAASKLFDKLDRDHDGTLDKRELRGRVNAKDFAAADPDNDGTLDKNEFLALVEKRFNAANPDNDGTIDAKELKSAAGRSLARLLN